MNTPRWPYPLLRLKPGKEVMLSKRHPWVFSGALARPSEAHLVRLADDSGQVLGVGTASPTNPLAARIFRFEDAPLDEAFFRARFESALALRKSAGPVGSRGRLPLDLRRGRRPAGPGGGPLRPGPGAPGGHGGPGAPA